MKSSNILCCLDTKLRFLLLLIHEMLTKTLKFPAYQFHNFVHVPAKLEKNTLTALYMCQLKSSCFLLKIFLTELSKLFKVHVVSVERGNSI